VRVVTLGAVRRYLCRVDAERPHLDTELKEVVVALAHLLAQLPCLSPDIDPMPSHKNSIRVRVVVHCLGHALSEVALLSSVLDDGDLECVEVLVVGLG
jgi:hypothetical protein